MSDSSPRSRSDAAATRQWGERLERFAAGNHTVAAFCAAEGVSQANFYLWRRRLAQPVPSPVVRVARAVTILAVADGSDYQQAARTAGRRSGDAVSHLVARFNREGLAALDPRHGGGHEPTYDTAARDRILREAARTPTPETDGTATWSLTILRRVLRAAPDGLPKVSTFTIWQVLRGAGYTFQRTRTWCPSGSAVRRRKAGVVTVTDPDAGAKKS